VNLDLSEIFDFDFKCLGESLDAVGEYSTFKIEVTFLMAKYNKLCKIVNESLNGETTHTQLQQSSQVELINSA